jgi:tetratricopeptide (TPR) repeat protein
MKVINVIGKPIKARQGIPAGQKGYAWRIYANRLAILLVLFAFIPTVGCKSSKAAEPPPPMAPGASVAAPQAAPAPAEEAPAQPDAAPEPAAEDTAEVEKPSAPPEENPLLEQPTEFPDPEEGEYTDYIEEDFEEYEYTREQTAPAPRAPQPQSVQIRRKGKSYDIIMNINPGDENVYVQMDIPDEEGLDISTGRAKEPESPFNRANKSLHQAQKHFYKKRYKLGLSEVNRALILAPDFAYAHALKGSFFYKLKKTDLAVQSWQTALQHDPSMDDVRLKLEELGY